MKLWKIGLGLALGILVCILPLNQWQPTPLAEVQTLAVQLDGRKKPLDTVARETVAQIHGRTSYQTASGERLDYLQTYLSLWWNNRDWNTEPFILFTYRPLKQAVGLNPEQKYFTFTELMTSNLGQVILEAKQQEAQGIDLNRNQREAFTIENRLATMIATVGNNKLPLIPHPNDRKGTWLGIDSATDYYSPEQVAPIVADYQTMRQAYRSSPQHSNAVENLAGSLKQKLVNLSPDIYPSNKKLQQEVRFSRLHPFGKAWMVYGLGLGVLLLVMLFPSVAFYEGAWGIFASGLIVHAYGFWTRMQIADRPPVTNMYESVIWVGFGVMAIALTFELIHRAKYYLLAAAPLAIVCLILADSLPAVLDPSIKPLVPVLRDNFWLSIHVPTITLSYASFALAMGLGHILLGHYLIAPNSTRIRSLQTWNYGVLQVGVLLLTAGIVLGGIWAHFSWGRFWGWDPKETWALIALMCYVVPLHGRRIGWLKDFGMAVTSVVAFNAVLMAWYGVNFVLGTGLHSYGFSTGGSELIVGGLVGLDLLFVAAVAFKYKSATAKFDSITESNNIPVQQL